MKVCAITNVYNESWKLPIWLHYYGRELGYENCVVIDHSSDDGSTKDVSGAGIFRIPRSTFDDGKRSRLISDFANGLLNFYDVVIYTDCDEILIPEPEKYEGLKDYCSRLDGASVTAIGLNVVHNLATEAPLDPSQPILGQRRFCQFVSPMCKTLIIKKKVKWAGGFHSSSFPVQFNSLYLFHLRHVDLAAALQRLAITRNLQWPREDLGKHQRLEYLQMVENFKGFASRQVAPEGDFRFDDLLKTVQEKVWFDDKTNLYRMPHDVYSSKLYSLPEKFFGKV